MNKQSPKLARARRLGGIAWRQRDEAEHLAQPPLPPDVAAGVVVHEWLFSGPGWAHAVRLLVPADKGRNRPRSDQFDLWIDGRLIAERTNITAALRLIQTDYLPSMPTRKQSREIALWQFSARDEADARAAHEGATLAG